MNEQELNFVYKTNGIFFNKKRKEKKKRKSLE